MPAPLPIQLRQRVVNAYKEKGGYQKIADQFDVCMDSVRRWVSLEKAQGSVDPMPHAGGPLPKILESQHSDLAELVKRNPTLPLPNWLILGMQNTKVKYTNLRSGERLRGLKSPIKKNLACH